MGSYGQTKRDALDQRDVAVEKAADLTRRLAEREEQLTAALDGERFRVKDLEARVSDMQDTIDRLQEKIRQVTESLTDKVDRLKALEGAVAKAVEETVAVAEPSSVGEVES